MPPDEPPSVSKIGAQIRRLRHEANLTLEDLSERSGLTSHFIGAIELGQRDPSVSSLQAIAGALGVPMSALLGETLPVSKKAIEMGRMFDQVPEALQKGILTLLRATIRGGRR
jgi:transcriptional regulator with XRE-family HTH domain